MEIKDSRWIDDDGSRLKEHRHGHYNWHFVHTKHRDLKLNPIYPEVNKLMRSSSYISLKRFAPFLIEKFMKEHIDQIGALVDKRGGPIEIYLDKLLEDVTRTGHKHFGFEVLSDSKYDEEIVDLSHMVIFNFCHDCYYIHEILHRMCHWESSYRQNRKRDKNIEEKVVEIISLSINTYLHNHLFYADIDKTWRNYKDMLKEVV